MIYGIIIVVVGIALFLSGIWEQNLVTIILGALLGVAGWIGFTFKWHAAKKQGQQKKDE
ncbi:hypothetical protein [Pseudidiomarina terrestris]|uniref:Uncharacterized protein n=1 Tax=Pseudidiomarina terrestris TaxID=2820060 RepID=A0AAW7R0C4_9GAMM|nr:MULTISPECIES: hypothetical protein [unclassified Pseudidiomarina]MDN7124075.1 hypothetical protein [Pseudidiomarina sp. 1APP75-32.1]MDN7127147.1 hypothetical protein [Pseudidiomarina sp. 1APR75-33.1]MDN7128332.1 hypothetical protein [Pseudidiomarina sp. 1APR75-15]MDN7135440.1 hypothetical protein [Pseudidiomarina sp. 1ASP75-5]MDN7138528.1 hypothetical protein [Pseudidiomarina sp. 1ASP75-14]